MPDICFDVPEVTKIAYVQGNWRKRISKAITD